MRSSVRIAILGAFMAIVASGASAQSGSIVCEWNFNSIIPDGNVGTGVATPHISAGTSRVFGTVVASFQSGDSEGGSSDGATTDNSGWQLDNFPAQGTLSGQAGVEFAVSTVGFSTISVTFDQRHSSTSSRYCQLQYSVDGINWTPAQTFAADLGGEQWYNQRTFSFSLIPAAGNNPNFKFRIVSIFDPVLGTAYTASSTGVTYDAAGAYRFDMVTVSGTPIAPTPISGVGAAQPTAVCAGGSPVVLSMAVHRGENPRSNSISVRANLTSLGGGASVSLLDNGLNGDLVVGDNTYSTTFNAPAGQLVGTRSIPITVTDGQGRSATSPVTIMVADCSQNSASAVVISQVYGGGGNTSLPASTYNADFIELYNRSGQTVDLTGWSVQYTSPIAPEGFASSRELLALSGVIKPGQYLLLLYTVPNTLGATLPRADFVLPAQTGIGRTGGKVALVRNIALLGANCSSTVVEDLVGYGGAAQCFEGAAPTATPDNNTSVIRKAAGAQDTNQQFNDFSVATPTPRNRTTGGFLAGYASSSDAGVCAGTSVTITVDVVSAVTPPSSGIQVIADLSGIGGAASVNVPNISGNTFSFNYVVPASVAGGSKLVPVQVTDAQGRSDASSLGLVVANCVPSASSVVISQVFGGNGSSGAFYNADYVELFNRSQAPVDLGGWSLQYAVADDPLGFVGSPRLVPLGGSIGPGEYRLIQTTSASLTVGVPIPAADFLASPTFGLDNEFGRVALVRDLAPLGTMCDAPAVEDLVGYGVTALCQEGPAPTAKLTAQLIARRKFAGCQDDDNNIVDFEVVRPLITDLPRNSLSPVSTCVVAPATGACCSDTACAITTASLCTGAFQGAGTGCGPVGNPTTCCIANFNQAGGVTVQDIFDFLNAYFASSPSADINGVSGVTVQDIFDFLNAYFAGCP